VIVAPTVPMLKNATLREFFKFCPRELIKDYNRTDRRITLITGAEVIGLSGDNERDIDRLRGMNIGGFYGDEIAICPEYMHDILIARLRDTRGPMKGWYTTTPKGFNWLHRLFSEKKNKAGEPFKNPDDYQLFGGSSMDNPFTDDEYKETLQSTYAGSFAKQEIYGEFVGFEGLVYPGFRRDVHIIKGDVTLLPTVRFVGGVDWGFTNPSVILALGVDSDDRIYVLEEFYEKRITHEQLKEKATMLMHKYSISQFYCDPSEPIFINSFNNEGIRSVGADNSIMPGIKEVSQRLIVQADGKPRLFIHQNCVNLINEFSQYRYPDDKFNRPVDEKPLKLFDHAMDALRYVCYSLQRMETNYGVVGVKKRR